MRNEFSRKSPKKIKERRKNAAGEKNLELFLTIFRKGVNWLKEFKNYAAVVIFYLNWLNITKF